MEMRVIFKGFCLGMSFLLVPSSVFAKKKAQLLPVLVIAQGDDVFEAAKFKLHAYEVDKDLLALSDVRKGAFLGQPIVLVKLRRTMEGDSSAENYNKNIFHDILKKYTFSDVFVFGSATSFRSDFKVGDIVLATTLAKPAVSFEKESAGKLVRSDLHLTRGDVQSASQWNNYLYANFSPRYLTHKKNNYHMHANAILAEDNRGFSYSQEPMFDIYDKFKVDVVNPNVFTFSRYVWRHTSYLVKSVLLVDRQESSDSSNVLSKSDKALLQNELLMALEKLILFNLWRFQAS